MFDKNIIQISINVYNQLSKYNIKGIEKNDLYLTLLIHTLIVYIIGLKKIQQLAITINI